MQPGLIYEEEIFSKWMMAIIAPVTVIMGFLFFYFVLASLGDPDPELTWLRWFFLLMFLFFLGITINFSRLIIRIGPKGISVGYGIIKYTIPWENIEGCFLDEFSAVRYGGAGIRMTKVEWKWILVFSVIGGSRVVVSLRKGRFKEIVFSTEHPQDVMKIIGEWAGIIRGDRVLS